jgi:uncharacterized protein (DUF1330 family)
MSAYVVVEIDIHDPKTYEQYKEMAPPSITAHNGRYLARGGRTETLEGDWQPARMVILEFPDLAHARAWWASQEYGDAKAVRQRSAHARMVAIEGIG